jgi:hypothetical protein
LRRKKKKKKKKKKKMAVNINQFQAMQIQRAMTQDRSISLKHIFKKLNLVLLATTQYCLIGAELSLALGH